MEVFYFHVSFSALRIYTYLLTIFQDSLNVYGDEVPGRDNTIQLNVVRDGGTFGRVVARWQATGQHNGIFDITPVEGRVCRHMISPVIIVLIYNSITLRMQGYLTL